MESSLAAELRALEALGRRRDLERIDHASPAELRWDFTSNDYLGLANDARLVDAACAALREHGAGARAARLLGGGSSARALEQLVADWQGTEAALLFPTGYQANVGLITSLAGAEDVLFSDALNHASLIDGMRLSKARRVVYPHLDFNVLERELARAGQARRRLIVTESVFSMDGDLADLDALNDLAERYEAWLLVDEAHAVGLLGHSVQIGQVAQHGQVPNDARGAVTPAHHRVLARVLTGGKALGSAGALIVGSADLIALVANRARSFIFTTAPPPSLAASLAAAIRIARREPEAARACLRNAKALAKALHLPAPAGAIVPIPIGAEADAVAAAEALAALGFDLRAVRPPTVPPGTCRLRAVCHAWQTPSDIDALVAALRDVVPALFQAQRTTTHRSTTPSTNTTSAEAHSAPTPRPFQRGERVPALFVTGTDTDIGKTVVAALLCRAWAQHAGAVNYWKPVQTGSDSDSQTVAALAELPAHQVQRPAWHLALPASPHEAAAAEHVTIQPARLPEALDGLRRNLNAPLVVELAGGLLVPFTSPAPGAKPVTQLDWLAQEQAPLVLVTRSGLGTLNHTMLSIAALRARHLVPRLVLLVGEPHASNAQTLRDWTGLPLIELPHVTPLNAAALDALIATHQGELTTLFASLPEPRTQLSS
jgi:8-amino-7-oxononanoate synthase/dethiobiotin synthase